MVQGGISSQKVCPLLLNCGRGIYHIFNYQTVFNSLNRLVSWQDHLCHNELDRCRKMKYKPTRDFVNTQDYISQRSYFIPWPMSGVYAYFLFQQIGNTRYLRLMQFLIFKISWNLSILWQRPSTPYQIRPCV